MKIIYFITLTLTFLLACNKEKRYSSFLMKGEKWKVVSVTVDGTALSTTGIWDVSQGVDIYKTVPKVIWQTDAVNSSIFEWQFQEKAKKFQLNYKQLCEECDGTILDSMDYFTYKLTGSYDVIKHRRSKMIFESSSTIGYPNQQVVITIEK